MNESYSQISFFLNTYLLLLLLLFFVPLVGFWLYALVKIFKQIPKFAIELNGSV